MLISVMNEGRCCPRFRCDICGKLIDQIEDGYVAYEQSLAEDGAEITVRHVHKSRCLDLVEAKGLDNGGDNALEDELMWLLHNLGLRTEKQFGKAMANVLMLGDVG